MQKLKAKWGIRSNVQLIIILLVFSINGSIALYVARPIMTLIHLSKESTSPWVFWPLRILIVFLVYQVTLVIVGALFGQKDFFWNMEKKMIRRIGLGFLLKDDVMQDE